MSRPVRDILGERFGSLVVIERAASDLLRKQARWLCRCDCGGQKIILAQSLTRGATRSCGCMRRERLLGRVPTLTHEQKLQRKREWRMKKLAAIASGERLTVAENQALAQAIEIIRNSPASTADLVERMDISVSTAQNYILFLRLRGDIELARISGRATLYRLVGSTDEPAGPGQSLGRYNAAPLASALGYAIPDRPLGVVSRSHSIGI